MALSDRNIVITPNIGASEDPKIVFSGANSSVSAQNITLKAYPTNNGTLSFEGSAGQLFSITNTLSGTIYSVNDVSGIPSIEVLDTGLVKLAQYSGNVLVGTGTDGGDAKFQVTGGGFFTGNVGNSKNNKGVYLGLSSGLDPMIQLQGNGNASPHIDFDNGTGDYDMRLILTGDDTLTVTGGYLNVEGSARSPIFYDLDNTGYYVDPGSTTYLYNLELSGGVYFKPNNWIQMNGSYGMYWPNTNSAHVHGNDLSSYGGIAIRGSRGGWYGIHFYQGGNTPHVMFDGSGNGGFYHETGGRWPFYYNYSNDCVGIGTSNTNASYSIYASKGVYSGSRVDGTIFYDSNNTGYYTDPNGTTNLNTMYSWDARVQRLFFYGEGGNSGAGDAGYAIYQQSGAWSHPYPDLIIGFHTGIKIGGYYGYNGTRFYNNNPTSGDLIASIGDGDNNLRSYYNIIAYASDRRLKENIVSIENALTKVMSLNGVTFDWKDTVNDLGFIPTAKHEVGVLAQEVEAVLPEAVEIAPFDYDWKSPDKSITGEKYLTVKYEKLTPLLIEAIKEQQQIIDRLQRDMEILKNEVQMRNSTSQ